MSICFTLKRTLKKEAGKMKMSEGEKLTILAALVVNMARAPLTSQSKASDMRLARIIFTDIPSHAHSYNYIKNNRIGDSLGLLITFLFVIFSSNSHFEIPLFTFFITLPFLINFVHLQSKK